ncbi:Uncharacterised protein [Mycobacterium tuberculosis]|uniref:Uncharacterized protein n=2 Tax=Mycobacterium tuberculosis TaxID=1773 RepID=A0A655IEZ2_MYCTX|nr:Uncharacterised protein [Mycobacterium tuberculosis]
MPASRAYPRTRSDSIPGASSHGAMTIRRAPWRRNRSVASASEASGRVMKAVVTAAHWVPSASLDATVEVRALAAGCDEPIASTTTPSVWSNGETPSSVRRSCSADTSRMSSPSTLAWRTR